MVVEIPPPKISAVDDLQDSVSSCRSNAIEIELKCASLSSAMSPMEFLSNHENENSMEKSKNCFVDVDQLPFNLLNGEEQIAWSSDLSDGTVYLTNYRLFLYSPKDPCSFINCPLGMIDSIEIKENLYLFIHCKDFRSFRLPFTIPEKCTDWWKDINKFISPTKPFENLFAVRFASSSSGKINSYSERSTEEISRLHLNKKPWRITYINKDHQLCSGYPEICVVPDETSDEAIREVAKFRSYRRFPTIVWRHENGAVIARTSQPEVGWLFWRSTEDENMIQSIINACYSPKTQENNPRLETTNNRLTILDARSYAAAIANRAKGGGFEYPPYYKNCDVRFMNLPNIHAIRKSAQALRATIANAGQNETWLSQLESTRWLQNLSLLIDAAVSVVKEIDIHGRPVLVHCSDGWDRTPQITTLSEVMLDPHYRTIKGFQNLVQREWIGFGHKFGDRCGHAFNSSNDQNERSPVFLQWLDCVYQIFRQKPIAFEFNEMFLLKLAHHTYTCLYGTFLYNSDAERKKYEFESKTFSVWNLLNTKSPIFRNQLFDPRKTEVLYPSASVRDLQIWSNIYLCEIRQTPTGFLEQTNSASSLIPAGYQSFEDLSTSMSNGFRRSISDTQLNGSLSLESSSATVKASNPVLNGSPSSVTYQGSLIRSQNSASTSSLFGPPHHLGTSHGSNHNVTNNPSNSNSVTTSPTNNNGQQQSCIHFFENDNREDSETRHNRRSFTTDDSAPDLTQLSSSIQQSCLHVNKTEDFPRNPLSSRHYTNSTSSIGSNMSDNGALLKTQSLVVNGVTSTQQQNRTSSTNSENLLKIIRKRIDVDGLTKIPDPITDRMFEKEDILLRQIENLNKYIKQIKRQYSQYPMRCDNNNNNQTPNQNHSDSGDTESIINSSVSGSDTSSLSSWQKVDENEGAIVRWVPDFQADACYACRSKFRPWSLLKKHHCRKCGRVFCHSCSSEMALVPEVDLINRVRVCRNCFSMLEGNNSNNKLIEPSSLTKCTTPIPIQNGCRETNGAHKGSFNSAGGQKIKG